MQAFYDNSDAMTKSGSVSGDRRIDGSASLWLDPGGAGRLAQRLGHGIFRPPPFSAENMCVLRVMERIEGVPRGWMLDRADEVASPRI